MKTIFILLLCLIHTQLCIGQRYSNRSAIDKKTVKENIKTNVILDSFENQLQNSIEKVTPACVLIITQEYFGKTRGMMASGVCVSEDGTIMTAGHIVIPGGKYEIVFPDGRKAPANGLGKIGKMDLGLLKITEEGEFPFAEMGYSASLKIGEPCFSLSYPGSFPKKRVIRFGHVADLNVPPIGSLRTTCLMEPGDSGGPVFDMDGKVIGIRSFIGLPLDENFEVPVDAYRNNWDALQVAINYPEVPESISIDSNNLKSRNKTPLWAGLSNTFNLLENELDNYSVIEITSNDSDSVRKALGTVVNLEGLTTNKKLLQRSYVISKSSEVINDQTVVINNKLSTAKVVYRDDKRDLVLLQLEIKSNYAVQLPGINSDSVPLGKFLISPSPVDDGEISILGTTNFDLSGVYNVGYLGMRLEMKDGKNIITSLQPNSAASKAMLKVGDVILDINRMKIESPADLIKELQKKKPREVISLVRSRDSGLDTLNIALQSRPFQGIDHVAEEFTDGRSERRDDFSNIFIHDAKLKPSECGGPIFDLSKRFIGINIARYSRTSSIGIPAQEIVEFLKAAIL